ncbi:LAQU0S03e01904g1_1 [Lachancea quebecensis]|uniref:LAQU0S03e01904g1_1 n=1 Tax=Lachancea quebecensis TaxID=1654605 RepID=A0A0P1KNG9_9SACH|nr:LAQU0S03e01904g1_1 [Lachancea quebecensis]
MAVGCSQDTDDEKARPRSRLAGLVLALMGATPPRPRTCALGHTSLATPICSSNTQTDLSHSQPMAASANVDPVIAAMAAAVAYGRESESPEPQAAPSASKPKPQQLGAKKRNWCWNWFAQDPNDKQVAVCDYCGRKVRRLKSDRGSPKKLLEHLHTHKITPEVENPARSSNTAKPEFTAGVQSFYKSIKRRRKPASSKTRSAPHPSVEGTASTTSANESDDIASDDNTISAQPAPPAPPEEPSEVSKFALKALQFLLENQLYLSVIFSPSFGDIAQRDSKPEIDTFLRHLEAVRDAEGDSKCMKVLSHRAQIQDMDPS